MKTIKVFYSHNEELWNAWSHAAGIVLGATVGTFWLIDCIRSSHVWATLSIALYLVGMLMSYVSSTVYHTLSARSPQKQRWRKFDHAAIYWHIAGSYSPITLIALRAHGAWGWSIFVFVWLCALIGTAVSIHGLKDHSNTETLCFVAIGLSILVAFKPLSDSLPIGTIAWIVAEGAAYIIGAVFYSLNKHRYMHTVFHFFVLLGTVCHIIAIWQILNRFLPDV